MPSVVVLLVELYLSLVLVWWSGGLCSSLHVRGTSVDVSVGICVRMCRAAISAQADQVARVWVASVQPTRPPAWSHSLQGPRVGTGRQCMGECVSCVGISSAGSPSVEGSSTWPPCSLPALPAYAHSLLACWHVEGLV